MSATIIDVAKLAGTSKSTVSRYLNGYPVKPHTEQNIISAIKSLNYHPNINARRLVSNKIKSIGVIVEDISNIFYLGILKGIEKIADDFNYTCIFYSSKTNKNTEKDSLHLLYEGHVEGLILISFNKRSKSFVSELSTLPFPIIIVGDHAGVNSIPSIDIDNFFGIEKMITYLHQLGHKNFAYIDGPTSISSTDTRLDAFKSTLSKLALPYYPQFVTSSDWSNRGGYEAMKYLLDKSGYSAIVASNDETAIGALQALQERGYKVPEDFSLVGFDNISISNWISPSLTTLAQPFEEIGQLAAKNIFSKIEGNNLEASRTLIKPRLVIRQSSGPNIS